MKSIKVNETLWVEIGSGPETVLRIVRRHGGLVVLALDEVSDLVAALSDLAARAAAELADQEYQEDLF